MLSRNIIIEALKRLGNELEKRELRGEIILTGGASMCLVHSARDMTKDVDALYEPKTIRPRGQVPWFFSENVLSRDPKFSNFL